MDRSVGHSDVVALDIVVVNHHTETVADTSVLATLFDGTQKT